MDKIKAWTAQLGEHRVMVRGRAIAELVKPGDKPSAAAAKPRTTEPAGR